MRRKLGATSVSEKNLEEDNTTLSAKMGLTPDVDQSSELPGLPTIQDCPIYEHVRDPALEICKRDGRQRYHIISLIYVSYAPVIHKSIVIAVKY